MKESVEHSPARGGIAQQLATVFHRPIRSHQQPQKGHLGYGRAGTDVSISSINCTEWGAWCASETSPPASGTKRSRLNTS